MRDWLSEQGWTYSVGGFSHELRFAFWNTSLYPPSSSARSKVVSGEKLLRARFVVDQLLDDVSVDVLALCEVDKGYAGNLADSLSGRGFEVESSVEQDVNFIQDNLLIYRRAKFLLIDKKDILHLHYSGRLKVATKYLMRHVNGQAFHFYVCHWPSRKTRAENGIGRDDLGYALRSEIEALGVGASVVIMGDFNDEPYNEGLADKLMASRDLALVANKPQFMYNPFWRRLGGVSSYSKGSNKNLPYGTYYWKDSKGNTKWHTFDQIIFSSSFVVGGEWHLKESDARIHDEFYGYILEKGASFDHLPVSAVIERD